MMHRSFMDRPSRRAEKDWSCVGLSFEHILAQLVDCALVDDAMGGHCRSGDFRQRGFRQAEGVPMLDMR